ncbi:MULTISPECIES: glycoside hydrolase family 3 N-terminal domain-containing protein [Corynebacterium]|nr:MULTISPECIES: glycoside hydrolase family 3 N-terminal domain-containing protein [Corynebacterium]WKD64648.1 Beta-hexosaminidase [Corynebacterium glucuronolyticum DSM 44120]SMB86731.1 beta-N-acetylhexosaminidase [Corynebacterium glucuronolyticum]
MAGRASAALACVALGCAGVLSACSFTPEPETVTSIATSTEVTTQTETHTEPMPVPVPADQRAQVASLMTVGVKDYDDALFALHQGVGGIFIASWTDPALLTDPERNIATLRREIGRPFAVTIDAEGGRVVRQPALLGDIPSPRVMAETMSTQQVEQVAYDLGQKLTDLGITVDFAPVLDTDAGPADGAIGDRSFSAEAGRATEYAIAFARGLSNAGVTPVFKHFPGHGRATGDTHTGSVQTPPLEELERLDLLPYGPALTEFPAAGLMVGHVTVPGMGDAPASLNPEVYELIRSGAYTRGTPFDGVIYTDDLSSMKAVSAEHSVPEAVLAALQAGADNALWVSTDTLVETIDTVNAAVDSGAYRRERMYDSAVRVAQLNHEGM